MSLNLPIVIKNHAYPSLTYDSISYIIHAYKTTLSGISPVAECFSFDRMIYGEGAVMKVSKNVFDYLLNHMLDIHKRKINIVRPYSSDYDTYTSMLEFLNTYIRMIGDFLDVAVVDEQSDHVPFVTMGSVVHTEGLGFAERSVFTVVLPEEVKASDASRIKACACLSPVSNALLFKSVGDRVMIEENGRMRQCTINRIDYP